MPIIIPDIDDLLAYILDKWIQNNNRAITGTIGQNVVWNLGELLKQNPENWDKATVVNDDGNYTTQSSECLIIFSNNSDGGLDFTNNIWNKWYFVNETDNDRVFLNGKFYLDINGETIDRIDARSVVSIAKGEDDIWYQTDNKAIPKQYTPHEPLQFEIGDVDSPMAEGDTELVVSATAVVEDSVQVFLDSAFLYRERIDRISYAVSYDANEFTITFNQGVINLQVYSIAYSQNL